MNKLDNEFLEKFEAIEKEFDELNELINSVEIISDNKLYTFYKQKFDRLQKLALKFKDLKSLNSQLKQNEKLLTEENDISFLNEIKEDINQLQIKINETFLELKNEFKSLKLSKLEKAKIEVGFKSGSKEYLLTILNLFENYSKKNGYSFEIEKQTETNLTMIIVGSGVFEDLSLFIGNTKILMFERETIFGISVLNIEDESFEFDLSDIKIETLKSGGAGGQHINKTESAVRAIHLPTSISVLCQDERSQLMNKERALENLKAKLNEFYSKNQQKTIKNQRKMIKNALFSNTPTTIFDFDKNIFYCLKTKQNYKLKEICDGDIKQIIRDVI